MACPICRANCRCRKAGPGGLCCGCHRHKNQKGFTRLQLDTWRTQHALAPVSEKTWQKSYAPHVAQLLAMMEE